MGSPEEIEARREAAIGMHPNLDVEGGSHLIDFNLLELSATGHAVNVESSEGLRNPSALVSAPQERRGSYKHSRNTGSSISRRSK